MRAAATVATGNAVFKHLHKSEVIDPMDLPYDALPQLDESPTVPSLWIIHGRTHLRPERLTLRLPTIQLRINLQAARRTDAACL